METFSPGFLILIIVTTLILLWQLKDDGFGSGLLVWLISLIVFFFLGYTADLSVLLGAIVGVGFGYIIAQFKAKEVPLTNDKKDDENDGEKKPQRTLFLPWRERFLNRFAQRSEKREKARRKRRRGVTRRP